MARRLELQGPIVNTLMFLGVLILRVIGANVLVRGASKLALSSGVNDLAIGLTIATHSAMPKRP